MRAAFGVAFLIAGLVLVALGDDANLMFAGALLCAAGLLMIVKIEKGER